MVTRCRRCGSTSVRADTVFIDYLQFPVEWCAHCISCGAHTYGGRVPAGKLVYLFLVVRWFHERASLGWFPAQRAPEAWQITPRSSPAEVQAVAELLAELITKAQTAPDLGDPDLRDVVSEGGVPAICAELLNLQLAMLAYTADLES